MSLQHLHLAAAMKSKLGYSQHPQWIGEVEIYLINRFNVAGKVASSVIM